MNLKAIDKVENISPKDFKEKYYATMKPLIITGLAKSWPAYTKWNWDYFIDMVGEKEVGVYNNVKSDSYTPIFQHAPQIVSDFTWPDGMMNGFIKKYPMLFVGGQGSITHMHFDIDMSHIMHTQFAGKKRVLLFPHEEQYKLYRKPWEVLSLANYANYREAFDYDSYPAAKLADGYEVILEHGDTLFMPAGYWHHMEYIEAGFAMSLRAMQSGLAGKIDGLWKLFAMRGIDTMMKKTAPAWWFARKKRQLMLYAQRELNNSL
jgi:hypothetical protein